jgi:putative endonuclease
MIKSIKQGKVTTYVGHTKDLKNRLKLHNAGKGAKFTRGRKWTLIYKEKLKSKKMAISREYFIKNNKKIRKEIKERRIYE